jgi:GTP cyclohydrolase II
MVEKQTTQEGFHIAAERAVDELRRQMGLLIQEDSERVLAAFPAEFLTQAAFSYFQGLPGVALTLVITGARARSIGVDATDSAVEIDAGSFSFGNIQAIADPLADKRHLPSVTARSASRAGQQILTLAKQASLLPAMLVAQGDSSLRLMEPLSRWISHWITLTDIEHYLNAPLLEVVQTAHARLPTQGGEHGQIFSFRSRHSTSVHLALAIGELAGEKTPLVRIHSSCVTGDILGSLRCDCGDQLQMALDQIGSEGKGLLIYLHQEGRGIGITNKLRAYRLQEQGMDTYEANLMLGFEEDERDFGIAAAILKKLNIGSIRMLTNNPHKMKSLEAQGIKISERIPLVAQRGAHNHAYMDAKAKKSGHQF